MALLRVIFRLLMLFPNWIGRIWHEIHEESIDRERRTLDYKPIVVLVFTALSLTVQEYIGDRGTFRKLTNAWQIDLGANWELCSFAWWTGWRVIGYLVVPVILVLCMPGQRLRDYGWSFRGFARHLWLYALLFLLVLPLVVMMAQTKDFQRIYPFYRLANRSAFDLWAWELMYGLQFLSLEFFFRGFMLHALKRSMGVHAIWVMIVPYCMIHYGKTFNETIGAIFAGIILGTVAMRTKSIWGGVVIHIGVAVVMDLLTVRMLP